MAERKKAVVQPVADTAGDNMKKRALETAIAQIERSYGKGSIMRLGDGMQVNVEALPTGSLSLDLALGGRADRELIRTGAEQAEVQALFTLEGEGIYAQLAELGVSAEDGQLLITRQLSASGRNVCRVGERMVSLAQLRQIAACLVEMHGQHEHQALTDPHQQLRYLDAFARRELSQLKADVARQYAVWRELRSRMRALNVDERESARRVELLRFEQKELDALKLKPGEDAELSDFLGKEEDAYERIALRDMLKKVMETLSPTERQILEQRYAAHKSQRQIAEEMGVSQMYVSRLERKLLERFRMAM